MIKLPNVGGHQARVNAVFERATAEWRDLYAVPSVRAEVFRQRRDAVLAWATEAALAAGGRVLEVGCGAGFVAVELARRGFEVTAVDSVPGMVAMTRERADAAGVGGHVTVHVGDANALAYGSAAFDVVIAVGVLAWVPNPAATVREFARVTAPGGHVIVTAGNRAALIYALDPFLTPPVQPMKRWVRRTAARLGVGRGFLAPSLATYHHPRFVDRVVADAGLVEVRSMTLGFGPFTLFGREVLPYALGMALVRRLERLARRGTPVVRAGGITYLVDARRSS